MPPVTERKVETTPQHDLNRAVRRHMTAALILLLAFLAASAAWLSLPQS